MIAGPLWAMDWLAERRQQVEQMTPAEKEELNEKYEKFLALPPERARATPRLAPKTRYGSARRQAPWRDASILRLA